LKVYFKLDIVCAFQREQKDSQLFGFEHAFFLPFLTKIKLFNKHDKAKARIHRHLRLSHHECDLSSSNHRQLFEFSHIQRQHVQVNRIQVHGCQLVSRLTVSAEHVHSPAGVQLGSR
jgi:hypothetical protein